MFYVVYNCLGLYRNFSTMAEALRAGPVRCPQPGSAVFFALAMIPRTVTVPSTKTAAQTAEAPTAADKVAPPAAATASTSSKAAGVTPPRARAVNSGKKACA